MPKLSHNNSIDDSVYRTPQMHKILGYKAISYNSQSKEIADESRVSLLKGIIADTHIQAISTVCKDYKYVVAIRETGTLSIKRIKEGAKAKPHTILEKSIKPSSINGKYRNPEKGTQILEKVKALNLDGFVGHWDDNGLVGVRVDNVPNGVIVEEKNNNGIVIKYIKVDLESPTGGIALENLQKAENWQKYLYTGDYDLHEAIHASGGTGSGQIMEACPEKVKLINRLNAGIQQIDSTRVGLIELKNGTLHMLPGSDYAMIQHGDQATYRMNQIIEARKSTDNKSIDEPLSPLSPTTSNTNLLFEIQKSVENKNPPKLTRLVTQGSSFSRNPMFETQKSVENKSVAKLVRALL